MKSIKLSITEDYVGHWSWWEGVRELMQNAIDTGDYEIKFSDEENAIQIISRGGKVPVNALLLGKTSKRNDNSKIGKFGEGMKLGFLVLVREGAEVFMYNHDELWEPQLVEDPDMESKVLQVDISEFYPGSETDHVRIVIKNIPDFAVEEIKANYAPYSGRKIVIENSRGKAYLKEEDHTDCNLFVNGLFVTKLMRGKYRFDYDFKPEAFTLDRDRSTVSSFEVEYEASRLLSESDDIELLANLALESYDDLKYFSGRRKESSEYYHFRGYARESDPTLESKAVELFLQKNGQNAYPINDSWQDNKKRLVMQMAHEKGYAPITVSETVYRMVQSSFDVNEHVEKLLSFNALEFLETFLEKHKRELRAKPRKDLEKVVHFLRIAEGKDE